MFFYNGCRCPVCDRPFQEDEDIVACPQCGAPHHRDCWKQEGHCHFEDRHAEGFRWEREPESVAEDAAVPPYTAEDADDEDEGGRSNPYRATPPPAGARATHCPRCGFPSPPYADFCSRCGSPLKNQANPNANAGYGEYAPFHATPADPCGGVDPKEDIDGVPAEELASCVRMNSAYYMPRFFRMAKEGGVSWNWAAFLAGPYWLLFRKCHLFGSVALGLMAVVRVMFMLAYQTVVLPLMTEGQTQQELIEAMLTAMQNGSFDFRALGLSYLLMGVMLLIHVLCGLLGNRLYMRTCLSRVKKLREQNPYGYRVFLSQNGGVSLFLGVLGYSAISLLQSIVPYFFLM